MVRSRRRDAVFGLFFAVLASTPLSAGGISKLEFAPTDPQAIVMVEELRGLELGQMRFEPMDVTMPKIVNGSFLLDKGVWSGQLKTAFPELQDYALPSFFSGYSTFSAIRRPAGVYAFTEQLMINSPGGGRQCPKAAMPVFRFKPGVVNLVPNAVLPMGGYSNFSDHAGLFFRQKVPENYRIAGTADSLASARRVIGERPKITAPVEYAEFLGYVAWQNSKGELSGCYHSKTLVWVTQQMIETAKIQD